MSKQSPGSAGYSQHSGKTKEPSVAESKTYPTLDYLRQLLRDKVPLFKFW